MPQWYGMRWKIEVFHKIFKSGCRAEDSRLRTAERLVNLIALFCVLSWRLFSMTMINSAAPEAPPRLALTRSRYWIVSIRPAPRPATQQRPLALT